MREFKVSVIIPVYNAEKYVRKAVESAVGLEEVGEVILIEDGSPDKALQVCEALVTENPKVKLYRHANGANRGAGASRNLGITHAKFDYIGFLDADDWYLPHRFTETKEIFAKDQSVDGVYAPIGAYFYEDDIKFRGEKNKKGVSAQVTYLIKKVNDDQLFSHLLRMKYGTFSTIGVVLKKQLLNKTGLFNEHLRLHQDTEMWLRCAFFGKLIGVASSKNPVSIRGVHHDNRIHKINYHSRALFFEALYNFYMIRKITFSDKLFILKKYLAYHPDRKFRDNFFVFKYFELCVLTLKTLFKGNP